MIMATHGAGMAQPLAMGALGITSLGCLVLLADKRFLISLIRRPLVGWRLSICVLLLSALL